MLTFNKVSDASEAASALQARLVQELQAGKRVLWLPCGGSNIPLIVQIMKGIPEALQDHLAIMLTDERYGEFGHGESNLFQMTVAGFNPGKASVVPVLTPENLPLDKTVERYNQAIATAFANADIIVGQFGMGSDGHTAGILPHSPAVASQQLVAGYDAGNFVRITLTPPALKQVDVGFAFIYGEPKREALLNLRDKNLPLDDQPAQILKQIPEVVVYNDQIGDER